MSLAFIIALPFIVAALAPIVGWLDRRDARATHTKGKEQ